MNTLSPKGAYSVTEFMAWASIGRTKFYQEVNSGKLKIRKIGAKTVVTATDADAWLNALPEAA
jgi:hypothetical protein